MALRTLVLGAAGVCLASCGSAPMEPMAEERDSSNGDAETQPSEVSSTVSSAGSTQDTAADSAAQAAADAQAARNAAAQSASELDNTPEQPVLPAGDPGCVAPEGVSAAPSTIDELVDLINSLPRPVELACFLQSLERPVDVFLTRSGQSAQPAVGENNPRVFFYFGDLSFTIVPGGGGESSENLEFAFRTGDILADRATQMFPNSDIQAVRGEIGFPVYRFITDSVLEDRVAGGLGSLCGGCHTGERLAQGDFFEGAFVSDVMPPFEPYDVELSVLREQSEVCDSTVEPERCDVLSAIFDYGEVRSVDFY